MTDLESLVRQIVRDELARARPANERKRRCRPCGTGHRMPECWGSVIYGPQGCYCR